MITSLRIPVLLGSLSLLILSGVSPCQEDPPARSGMRNYKLKNGDSVRAEVISVEAGMVRYRFSAGGGSGITSQNLDRFEPRSQYNIRATVAPDDVQTHMDLAAFAIDHGLIAEARRELFRARDLVKDQELAPELLTKIMDQAVRILEEYVAKGSLKEAHMILIESVIQTIRCMQDQSLMMRDQ